MLKTATCEGKYRPGLACKATVGPLQDALYNARQQIEQPIPPDSAMLHIFPLVDQVSLHNDQMPPAAEAVVYTHGPQTQGGPPWTSQLGQVGLDAKLQVKLGAERQ
jgi:hypothetical protein